MSVNNTALVLPTNQTDYVPWYATRVFGGGAVSSVMLWAVTTISCVATVAFHVLWPTLGWGIRVLGIVASLIGSIACITSLTSDSASNIRKRAIHLANFAGGLNVLIARLPAEMREGLAELDADRTNALKAAVTRVASAPSISLEQFGDVIDILLANGNSAIVDGALALILDAGGVVSIFGDKTMTLFQDERGGPPASFRERGGIAWAYNVRDSKFITGCIDRNLPHVVKSRMLPHVLSYSMSPCYDLGWDAEAVQIYKTGLDLLVKRVNPTTGGLSECPPISPIEQAVIVKSDAELARVREVLEISHANDTRAILTSNELFALLLRGSRGETMTFEQFIVRYNRFEREAALARIGHDPRNFEEAHAMIHEEKYVILVKHYGKSNIQRTAFTPQLVKKKVDALADSPSAQVVAYFTEGDTVKTGKALALSAMRCNDKKTRKKFLKTLAAAAAGEGADRLKTTFTPEFIGKAPPEHRAEMARCIRHTKEEIRTMEENWRKNSVTA
jgi:hypothetical protein